MHFNGRLVKLCPLLRVIILVLCIHHANGGTMSFAQAGPGFNLGSFLQNMQQNIRQSIQNGLESVTTAVQNGRFGIGSSSTVISSNGGVISVNNGVINCGGQICPQGSTGCHLEIHSIDNDRNIRTQQICYGAQGNVVKEYAKTKPNPNPGNRVYVSSTTYSGSWHYP